MMLRMLDIIMKTRRNLYRQRRIMRHAQHCDEMVLRDLRQGYAWPDVHEFAVSGPGGDHRIYIAVPPAAPPPGGYPVLFLVDGDAIFGTAVDAMRLQMPWPDVSHVLPFMLVGVGYPGTLPFNHARRSWDLAPALRDPTWRSPLGLPWHQPGGADEFVDFLTGQLLEAIAARYPLNRKRRGVCGISLGGTFALHALASHPDAFSFHAAVSSALWFDNERVIDDLRGLPDGSRSGTGVVLAIGGQELPADEAICSMMLRGSRAAAQEIERLGANLSYSEWEAENHQSTIIAAMPHLMRRASAQL